MSMTVEALAEELNRLDTLFPDIEWAPEALATILIPFIERHIAGQQGVTAEWVKGYFQRSYTPAANLQAVDDAFTEWAALHPTATPQPPKPAGYDRELIANMLEGETEYLSGAVREQIKLLRAADNAEAAGVHTASKPAGAVSLPLPIRPTLPDGVLRDTITPADKWTIAEALVIRSYGDAREAAGRTDAVPALDSVLRERGLPTVADALGYSRNFAAANPALSQTTRDHIEGLCNMLEIAANHPAPAPQQMTTQGEADALLREVCQELIGVGCEPCRGSDAPMEDLHGRIADYFANTSTGSQP